MSKKARIMTMVGVALLVAVAIGGSLWAYFSYEPKAATADASPPPDPYKYVGTERIVVMLKQPDVPASLARGAGVHYAVLDIVLKTRPEKEAATRAHLLLLRSLVVEALSGYTFDALRRVNIDQLSGVLNKKFAESYRSRRAEMPFETVMISKLLAE
ncbi:flagellar basal body rod protein [Burkholderia sp. ABCPW 14]|uniref:flagellar basal body-associated FliL family protein n=1 Tax=Burkholderia sp. ABCPW 14 TaxID=1637860 RepID=UPI000770D367|nr:flagellar basal body rod protein [Burkholderia sp. ABCPW 14]KVD84403.1 flagellar basal body rod protein [Burkholderia sp. ABCPW 14]